MIGDDNWTVDWAVYVTGQNMTDRFRPYLIDIEVTDKAGESSDTCSLTLHDDLAVAFPAERAEVMVAINGIEVFVGYVDTSRSSGSRGGGRLIKVGAKSYDLRGKAKDGQTFHKDDATLQDFLGEAAQKAGYSLHVDQSLAGKQRPYWVADNESFVELGERLAREFNATFKLRGDQAVLVPRGATLLATVRGIVGPGGNVISWDIAPYTGWGKYSTAKARWFDRKEAKFKEKDITIEGVEADSTDITRALAADEGQAEDIANGRKSQSNREAGGGSVELTLTLEAQAEALFALSGARPGVDGTYRIETVTHKASRSGGATTRLELKEPQDGAGKDSRSSKGRSSGDDEGAGDTSAVPEHLRLD